MIHQKEVNSLQFLKPKWPILYQEDQFLQVECRVEQANHQFKQVNPYNHNDHRNKKLRLQRINGRQIYIGSIKLS